jgi:hypothetical protein
MAHYAFLDVNNIVTEVIAGIDETELIEGLDPETWYGNLRNQTCKRTSYNAKIRGVYAGVGFTYNAEEDIFITISPYPSWIRNGSLWEPPTPHPVDENNYQWNEETLSWDKIQDVPVLG